jgi:hypothetical protein
MTVNLPSHAVNQYSSNVDLKLQQKGSKLRHLVSTGTHEGSQASPVDQFGAVEAQAPAGRFAPLNRVDAAVDRRWVFPTDRELPQLIDSFDKLRTITDPESQYVTNAANAFGRFWDDIIIDAALGTSYIGVAGAGTEAFDTSTYSIANDFGAAASVGLTVAKIIEAQRLFMVAEVDLDNDPSTLIISPTQHANLLNQVEVVSTDYNMKPILDGEGKVKNFLGFNIIVSNRLDSSGSTDRHVIAFVKSGMYLGIWEELTHNVSVRTDLSSQPWQLYSKNTAGATRLEQGKVLRILCGE